ncbi:histidine phosphatase family protein [Streptomyces hainanensis]|uniref:Histidine phosphatase family protein n=1 Tax=Streptomyces hainanensis TaxID=402648 RepID=A0A4R4TGG1_9ACTN|nr:histidine phosphatase family protein [Streptomyces hainanensis]TDC74724.1 histidine phosphatase family protein [Streptomyces hainanensis]
MPPRAAPVPPRNPLAELVAVRHAESTANVRFAAARRGGGPVEIPSEPRDADVPLSDTGLAQAAALGRWLAGLGADRGPELVVCSPYLRAGHTWELMAEAAAPGPWPAPLVDERLRDREMGVFELLPGRVIRERVPDEADRRERLGDWYYRPPGGESPADVALRVRDLLTELAGAVPGRRVLLVAHDAVVAAVRHVLAGLGAPPPVGEEPVANASVSRWVGDGDRLRLVTYGAVDHLPG